LSEDWEVVYTPIVTKGQAVLKAVGLDKTPGANMSHVILGFAVQLSCEQNWDEKKIQQGFTFTDSSPYFGC